MLAQTCLLSASNQGTVLLNVTPTILAAALVDAGESALSPSEAMDDFMRAVREVYWHRVIGDSRKLATLYSANNADVPFALGFLALSVLAAYDMHTDEERSANAYYPRLADLLGCQMDGSYPAGFDGFTYRALWGELAQWLKEHYNRTLAIPHSAGMYAYLEFPLAHVPFRQIDIEKLPLFFESHGYEPGIPAALDRLAHDLLASVEIFSRAGKKALRDSDRLPFVIRQVAHELEHWDGYREDRSGARVASIELWLDFRRRRAEISMVARRPEGFPTQINDGEFVFVSSQERWYEPVLLDQGDGYHLEYGLRVSSWDEGRNYILNCRAANVIPLTPSDEFSGLISDHALRENTKCAVLCKSSMQDTVRGFLEQVCGRQVIARSDQTLPEGWVLFADVIPKSVIDPPSGLERLRIESSVTLIPQGGLRLKRRWTWLSGAMGRVTIVGTYDASTVRIDGEAAVVGEDGTLPAGPLSTTADHTVDIGNQLRQRISVVEGQVSPDCKPWHAESSRSSNDPLILPRGHWVLVGSRPGQHLYVDASDHGALVRPQFNAVWAIGPSNNTAGAVVHLHDNFERDERSYHPQVELRGNPKHWRGDKLNVRRWAEAIYQSSMRRPKIACTNGCPSEQVLDEWKSLARSAQGVKRQVRKLSR